MRTPFRGPHAFAALSLLALLAITLWAPEAHAAKGAAQAATAAGIIKSASVIGPLGISPFFALAGFGLAGYFGIWELPSGLQPFSHPLVWVLFIALGGLLQFGRSTKLTKPIAEALGTGESVFAVVATLMVMIPHFQSAAPVVSQAGVTAGLLLTLAGLTAVIALVILRTALDILIWLSPIPFVDGMFQVLKLVVTVGLVLLAVLFPPAAIVVNLIILVATALLVRWSLRTARFGITLAHDLTLGRLGAKAELPRDEVAENDLGPFDAFVLQMPGIKKRTPATLNLDAGRWFLTTSRAGRGDVRRPLCDDEKSELNRGLLGLELTVPEGRILLPPRYKHLFDEILASTEVQKSVKPALLSAKGIRRPQPQASAI